ncbi:hypothetical protein [Rhizobium johnstonii]|uniref:hypothetical protein n=1 Tax=Rhizobium johnstonii TaxID=3019933 RepID=UPI003F9E1D32
MPRFFTAIIFLATLWAVSAEKSSAAMWLIRGPANTSMAADPACKGRNVEQKEYIVHGTRVATYRYFPDPIATMIDTFNFATIQNPPF